MSECEMSEMLYKTHPAIGCEPWNVNEQEFRGSRDVVSEACGF